MRRYLFGMALGSLLLTISMGAGAADPARVTKCESEWSRVSGATEVNGRQAEKATMLQNWLAVEPRCRGTGVFEYRLATLYIATGQPNKAMPLLVDTESWPGDYPKIAPFIRLNAQMQIFAAETPFPRAKFNALKPEFLAALAIAPNTAIGNEQIAGYLALTGDYADAVKYANRSLEIDQRQWEANRTLTIAYVGLGKFSESIASGAQTVHLNSDIVKDPYFMYALAKAYSGAGNIDAAEKVLAALATKVPSARGTEDWKGTIAFMRDQVRAQNGKK
jgi:tetratricopeptide (TPR) repeat protein